ncbi:F0F1 ATP synthase subunit gamma [Legionella fallonii]|uniref:Truncated ATP synthase gamma subunit n=1 Tax=Legionella fallonii LLAP-10 TaxID=1212491 RepID=A0A098GAZ9_9GAMM|nr:F0F1 ATP synthase subunit gamma [Legionella fallonii]CEG59157.1 Truncated ATP synthase gamma subunit [Legionella fallonii LLAP-10]
MTKRTKLKEHLHTLEEIGDIMTAMKNLCFIEMNKITKVLVLQEQVMQTLREVSRDFLSFYPIFPTNQQEAHPAIYILIGSERGFCGSFNDNVMHQLDTLKERNAEFNPALIVVGRKLALKMADDARVMATIDGPNAIEEIPAVILNLLQTLEKVSSQRHIALHSWQWDILCNEEEHNQIQAKTMQPFKEFCANDANHGSIPPLLNLAHEQFLAEFVDHYLFSMCYSVFYQSFFAENHQRLFHLNSSLDRLESKKNSLKEYLNLLRQEEITEEIQIIMLSAEALIGTK